MSPRDRFEDPFFRDKFDDPIVFLKGLSSADLQKVAKIAGIDSNTLQKLALGKIDLSKPDLEKISKALGTITGR